MEGGEENPLITISNTETESSLRMFTIELSDGLPEDVQLFLMCEGENDETGYKDNNWGRYTRAPRGEFNWTDNGKVRRIEENDGKQRIVETDPVITAPDDKYKFKREGNTFVLELPFPKDKPFKLCLTYPKVILPDMDLHAVAGGIRERTPEGTYVQGILEVFKKSGLAGKVDKGSFTWVEADGVHRLNGGVWITLPGLKATAAYGNNSLTSERTIKHAPKPFGLTLKYF